MISFMVYIGRSPLSSVDVEHLRDSEEPFLSLNTTEKNQCGKRNDVWFIAPALFLAADNS
jgi:hypothetical protein